MLSEEIKKASRVVHGWNVCSGLKPFRERSHEIYNPGIMDVNIGTCAVALRIT
jgi:hypothetical protein